MYHEERIINGILCWRGTPDGEWIPCTAAQLTARWRELQQQLEEAGITPKN